MTSQEIADLINVELPDATVFCEDLTGTGDHWKVIVVSAVFEAERLIAQHRRVNDSLDAQLKGGELHALSLKTYTPEAWKQAGSPTV